MHACRDVFRMTQADLSDPVAVIRIDNRYVGMIKVDLSGQALDKLFVCPDHMGKGFGAALLDWAKSEARFHGIESLSIESDPGAAPFYQRHGAYRIGEAPSEVIPGRMLPLLRLPTSP